jgi:hypothetical protein
MLRRAAVGPGVLSLDAEDVASALSHVPVTYRVVRPLVHATHLLRVARACWADAPCVATTDPLTSPARQVLLRTAARWSGRELLVVLLYVAPEQARDGQRRRGRLLSERRVSTARAPVRAPLGRPSRRRRAEPS